MRTDKGPHARPFEFEGWFKDTMKGFGDFFDGPWGHHHWTEKDGEWERKAAQWQHEFMKMQRQQLVFIRSMIDSAIEHLDKKAQKA
jgi:hypothetical protein